MERSQKVMANINRLSSYMKFESGNQVQIVHIDKYSQRFERCKKALNERNNNYKLSNQILNADEDKI